MSNIEIDWSKLNTTLRDEYQSSTLKDDTMLGALILNEKHLDWISLNNMNSSAYEVFAKEVNRIELAINLFENLLKFEDVRHEHAGIDDFVIDIPRYYFRFPANNCTPPHVSFSVKEFSDEEQEKIEYIIKESREAMPLRNDENIVRELFHRLEFLAIFSYFEAFLEQLLGESIWIGSEEDRIKANRIVMKNPLPIALQKIIEILNPEIDNLLKVVEPEIYNMLHFCYLMRNIHTHNLGRVTNFIIKQGLEFGSLQYEELRSVDGELIRTELNTTHKKFGKSGIEKGKYMTLSSPVSLLRIYTKEIAYILDQSIVNA